MFFYLYNLFDCFRNFTLETVLLCNMSFYNPASNHKVSIIQKSFSLNESISEKNQGFSFDCFNLLRNSLKNWFSPSKKFEENLMRDWLWWGNYFLRSSSRQTRANFIFFDAGQQKAKASQKQFSIRKREKKTFFPRKIIHVPFSLDNLLREGKSLRMSSSKKSKAPLQYSRKNYL